MASEEVHAEGESENETRGMSKSLHARLVGDRRSGHRKPTAHDKGAQHPVGSLPLQKSKQHRILDASITPQPSHPSRRIESGRMRWRIKSGAASTLAPRPVPGDLNQSFQPGAGRCTAHGGTAHEYLHPSVLCSSPGCGRRAPSQTLGFRRRHSRVGNARTLDTGGVQMAMERPAVTTEGSACSGSCDEPRTLCWRREPLVLGVKESFIRHQLEKFDSDGNWQQPANFWTREQPVATYYSVCVDTAGNNEKSARDRALLARLSPESGRRILLGIQISMSFLSTTMLHTMVPEFASDLYICLVRYGKSWPTYVSRGEYHPKEEIHKTWGGSSPDPVVLDFFAALPGLMLVIASWNKRE
ncbi:hypothetical protein B0H11DRAFT_2196333 [Mycena galericulata]|nr:hypothetical protein B0H11DRAFT_2196333 [Mycena galericulata]